jgi:heme-degrading monooxygenase HmoA
MLDHRSDWSPGTVPTFSPLHRISSPGSERGLPASGQAERRTPVATREPMFRKETRHECWSWKSPPVAEQVRDTAQVAENSIMGADSPARRLTGRENRRRSRRLNSWGYLVFVIIWSFQPRPERVSEFEIAYGPEGVWARLFRKSPHYLGTELLRTVDGSGRYLTIDRWQSRAAYETFCAEHGDEYQAVDRACESITLTEEQLGEFDAHCDDDRRRQ